AHAGDRHLLTGREAVPADGRDVDRIPLLDRSGIGETTGTQGRQARDAGIERERQGSDSRDEKLPVVAGAQRRAAAGTADLDELADLEAVLNAGIDRRRQATLVDRDDSGVRRDDVGGGGDADGRGDIQDGGRDDRRRAGRVHDRGRGAVEGGVHGGRDGG